MNTANDSGTATARADSLQQMGMPPEREHRELWAVVDWGCGVAKITGYSCAPTNPDHWWCPVAGFSGTIGRHLFETEDGALKRAIEETETKISDMQERLKSLKARRHTAEIRRPGPDAPESNPRRQPGSPASNG